MIVSTYRQRATVTGALAGFSGIQEHRAFGTAPGGAGGAGGRGVRRRRFSTIVWVLTLILLA